jgi:hypothetical protein
MLTKTHIKLLVPLLKRAAQEFSNHGCNDLNLDEFLTEEERAAFITEVNAIPNFGDEPFDDDSYALPDWLVMKALIKKLEKESG